LDGRLGLPADTVLDDAYRILRQIGSGGFGITYAAEDTRLGRTAAIKEYYPEEFGDRDPTMRVRPKSERHKSTFDWGLTSFIQEARTLARFQHPSVVRVSRVFEAHSTAYMVMDFEQGQNFETWLRSLGRLPTQEELDRIVAPLLDALEIMHGEDFLHRDIAPDNIIIRTDGSPVLLDFGAARRAVAERSRVLTGIVKAGYSPHEQYATDNRMQGPWSDLYALGATLYRAVTGKPPEEAAVRMVDDRVAPTGRATTGDYRPGFLAGIDACLRVRPADRPQSVAETRELLFDVPKPTALATSGTRRWAALAAGVVLMAVVGGVAEFARRQTNHGEQQASATAAAKKAADADVKRQEEARLEAERARREADAAAVRRKAEEAGLEQAFLESVNNENWAEAEGVAPRLLSAQPAHRSAHTFMGLAEFKAGNYAQSNQHFLSAGGTPVNELTSILARAWVYQAQGRTEEALGILEAPSQPDWAQFYLRYHRALLTDAAGRAAAARVAYDRIPKEAQRIVRVSLAFARHAANAGDSRVALNILKTSVDKAKGEEHPVVRDLRQRIEAGERPGLLVTTPTEGLAEALYGPGETLTGDGKASAGAEYLHFALYLIPDSLFALTALANNYETVKRYEAAITTYDRVPKGNPLQLSIDIRKALNLAQLERIDEAQKLLEEVAREHPREIQPLDALGNIMRGSKRFAKAIDYYTRAIALIDKPEAKHWTYFYMRGTCHERMKQWPEAEADLLRALQLNPDQPLVLNYLGYSWIDQNRNLKQALGMLEKAARLKPSDGYIADSVGWAQYRLGNFSEALRHIQRGVSLQPDDPVLNDHLGDVLWKLGQRSEARAKWEKALTLNPEPADAEKIRSKVQAGLPSN
jgi:tetratricopeptide (TPR) repeat protein/tRNA A-37 threonylcarbamoyl transferase component Bud32